MLSNSLLSNQGEHFRPAQRLKAASDYAKVFRNRQVSTDAFLVIFFSRNHNNIARLGLAIGKKAIRSAARRNLIKRLTRESFRRHQQQLHGLDIVVTAKTGASGIPNRALFKSLEKHWKTMRYRKDRRS